MPQTWPHDALCNGQLVLVLARVLALVLVLVPVLVLVLA